MDSPGPDSRGAPAPGRRGGTTIAGIQVLDRALVQGEGPGASGEGGLAGTFNETYVLNGLQTPLEANLRHLEIGSNTGRLVSVETEYDPITGEPPEGYGDMATVFRHEVRDDGIYVQVLEQNERIRTVSDIMVETMANWGVTHVFGMVGHSNLGLADASALCTVIEEAIDTGDHPGDRPVLRRYERARKGPNATMLHLMTGLNQLFAAGSPTIGELRRAGMRLFNVSGPLRERAVRVALGSGRR